MYKRLIFKVRERINFIISSMCASKRLDWRGKMLWITLTWNMININWFFRDGEWKHVDVRNFFFAFGEPMILEALVKYDRIVIFCGKKLQSCFSLLRFTMFTCCDNDILLPLRRLSCRFVASVVWLLRGHSYWWIGNSKLYFSFISDTVIA